MPRIRLVIAVLLVVALQLPPAQAQQMDMQTMMRWAQADVIRYHIVGVYDGRVDVVADPNEVGYADVTDRVVIDLTWKLSSSKLVGPATFVNEKSVAKNLRNFEPKCLPPVLKGEYEHYELLAIKDGPDGGLALQVQTAYPAADVVQFCTGSRKAMPASRATRLEEMAVVSPVMFGMPLPDSGNVRISPDKKSIVVKKDGWTWTYTPSIVPR